MTNGADAVGSISRLLSERSQLLQPTLLWDVYGPVFYGAVG
jgi:hypothetical protein